MTRDELRKMIAKAIAIPDVSGDWKSKAHGDWTLEADAILAALNAAGLVVVPRDNLNRLISTAKLLQANSEGCAVNHYGEDFYIHGLPGYLSDTQADIDAMIEAAGRE